MHILWGNRSRAGHGALGDCWALGTWGRGAGAGLRAQRQEPPEGRSGRGRGAAPFPFLVSRPLPFYSGLLSPLPPSPFPSSLPPPPLPQRSGGGSPAESPPAPHRPPPWMSNTAHAVYYGAGSPSNGRALPRRRARECFALFGWSRPSGPGMDFREGGVGWGGERWSFLPSSLPSYYLSPSLPPASEENRDPGPRPAKERSRAGWRPGGLGARDATGRGRTAATWTPSWAGAASGAFRGGGRPGELVRVLRGLPPTQAGGSPAPVVSCLLH